LVSRQQSSHGHDRTSRIKKHFPRNSQTNMSLITCPDCRHDVSDAAQACIHCGRPLTPPMQQAATTQTRHEFFPVALHKFVVLSLCTLSFYTLYWCYQNWWRIRERTGEQLSPFWRAVFEPFWVFSLFSRIRGHARERGVAAAWDSTVLGLGYLLLCAMGSLPDPWWLAGLGGFIPFLPVVQTIQQLNEGSAATESRNDAYSGGNVATILVGGVIVLLAVAGTFMSEEEEVEFEPLPESTGWTSSRPEVRAAGGGQAGYFTS
jgi:hypothetical protein